MKKRAVMAAMVAALVLSQATTAFAAGSTSSGGSGRATVSATYADEVSVTLNGNTTTPNYGGEASNGATSVAFVKGETHAVAGLPNGIVDTINAINRNKADLANVGTGLDLKGYNALIGTHAIMTYQAGTKVEKTGDVSIDLYVPNPCGWSWRCRGSLLQQHDRQMADDQTGFRKHKDKGRNCNDPELRYHFRYL